MADPISRIYARHLRAIFDVRGACSPADIVRGLRRVCLGSVDSQSASFKPLACAVCSLPSYRAVREPRRAIVFVRNSHNGRPMPVCAFHAKRSATALETS